MHVLVAYATKNGSTAEVAEAIAAVLREAGAEVTLAEAARLRELPAVDAVVVGAPLYNLSWLAPARRFLRRHRDALEKLPVAVFALGPRRDDAEAFARSRQQLDRALAKADWLTPVAVAVFGGADPPRKKDRADIRDWDAIRDWAAEVARRL